MSALVVNSHLMADPVIIRQPGFDLPRQHRFPMNRLRTASRATVAPVERDGILQT